MARGFDLTIITKDHEVPDELRDIYVKAGFVGGVPARSRGPFVAYLMADRDYTYDQVADLFEGRSGLSDDDKQQLVDDFIQELKSHPLVNETTSPYTPHPDAEENSKMYTRWFKDSINKMKDCKFPSADEFKTPEDVSNYYNSQEYLDFKGHLMDMGQEYEKMFKLPGIGPAMQLEIGEDTMKVYNSLDSVAKAADSICKAVQSAPKGSAFFFSYAKEFFERVGGKNLGETDTIENYKTVGTATIMFTTTSGTLLREKKTENPQIGEYIRTGKLPDEPIRIGGQTLDELKNANEQFGMETAAGVMNDLGRSYGKMFPGNQLQQLACNLPENLEFDPAAPEKDQKEVHRFYQNTAGCIPVFLTFEINSRAGVGLNDLIEVGGESLSHIVETKYAGTNLSAEQKQIAEEYEFVSAITSPDKKVTYRPYVMNGQTGEISQAAEGKELEKCEVLRGLDKFRMLRDNFAQVDKAYFRHNNSKEYGEMMTYLENVAKAKTNAEFKKAKEELALKAEAYLEHTGYDKAWHDKSETRRQLAFYILDLTDEDKFKKAQDKANAQRKDNDKIYADYLEKKIGVGKPAAKRNKVDLKELTREENALKNKKDVPKKKRPEMSLNDAFIAEPPKKGNRKGKGK